MRFVELTLKVVNNSEAREVCFQKDIPPDITDESLQDFVEDCVDCWATELIGDSEEDNPFGQKELEN